MADHSPTEIALQHPTDPGSMRAQNWETADLARSTLQPPPGSNAPPLQPATLAEVEILLNGFRMLTLRHFIRRQASASLIISEARSGVAEQEAAPFPPGVYLVLLTKSPQEIAENDVLLRQLCSSIEG